MTLAIAALVIGFLFPIMDTMWGLLRIYDMSGEPNPDNPLRLQMIIDLGHWNQSRGHMIMGIWLEVPLGALLGAIGAVVARQQARQYKNKIVDMMCVDPRDGFDLKAEWNGTKIMIRILVSAFLAGIASEVIASQYLIGSGFAWNLPAAFALFVIYPTWKSAYLRAAVKLRRAS